MNDLSFQTKAGSIRMTLRRDDAFDAEAVHASFAIRSVYLMIDHSFPVCARDPLTDISTRDDLRMSREFFNGHHTIPCLGGTLENLRDMLAKMQESGMITEARCASVADSLVFESQLISTLDGGDPRQAVRRLLAHAVNNEGLDAVAATMSIARTPDPRVGGFMETLWTPFRARIEAAISAPQLSAEELEPCAP